jgi:hypothetical protein
MIQLLCFLFQFSRVPIEEITQINRCGYSYFHGNCAEYGRIWTVSFDLGNQQSAAFFVMYNDDEDLTF